MNNDIKYKIKFPIINNDIIEGTETCWAEQTKSDEFTLLNSPFYLFNFSYLDVVSANFIRNETQLEFKKLIKRSGHSTYRIFLLNNKTSEAFHEFWTPLEQIGCTYEKANKSLFSIDIPHNTNIHKAYKFLKNGEDGNIWEFEEAHVGHKI